MRKQIISVLAAVTIAVGATLAIAPAQAQEKAKVSPRRNAGTDTKSFGGVITSNSPFTGTYTVNADCTGTLTVNFGFFSITNNMVIVDNGKEINIIETNPGTVATGVLKRQ